MDDETKKKLEAVEDDKITSPLMEAANRFAKKQAPYGDLIVLDADKRTDDELIEAVRFDAFMEGAAYAVERFKDVKLQFSSMIEAIQSQVMFMHKQIERFERDTHQ